MSTITLPSGATVEIDTTARLKMREFRQWIADETAGNYDASYGYLSRFVKSWSFKLSPKEVASYDELDVPDFRALNRYVTQLVTDPDAEKN